MTQTYKIDDVAKACGLTKRTIRYYEEIGLLPPPERSEGGIRLYTREHIDRLNRLIDARDVLGFSLQELQHYLGIIEELEDHRKGYRELADDGRKLRKLLEIEPVVRRQLDVIGEKLDKMLRMRQEIEEFHGRVRAGIERLGGAEAQEKKD